MLDLRAGDPNVPADRPAEATTNASPADDDAAQSQTGPRPPWERFGSAEDFPTRLAAERTQLTDAIEAEPSTPSPTPGSPEPAGPPNQPEGSSEHFQPRTRRPLWRDEVGPDQAARVPRSEPARRSARSTTPHAVEDTDERANGTSGLPGWAAILLGVATTTAAGAIDLFWSGQIGIFFTVCFGVLAFVVAATIRRTEFFTAIVLPPLELLITLVVLGLSVPERLNPAADGWFETVMSSLAASWVALVAAIAITLGMLVIRWALRPSAPEEEDS